MSYGIDESVQESNVSSHINAGIQDNIQLQSVVFESMKENSDPVVQVNFVDEYGSTLREILWEVNEDQIREWNIAGDRTHSRTNKERGWVKGEPVKPDEAVQMAYDLFKQRAKHIATKFATEEAITEALSGAGSYEEFGEAYSSLFTEARISDVFVRLKVVLDKNDYSKLPKYPPFIESMGVPKEKSKLEIDPKYDRITKSNADAEADDPMTMAEGEGDGIPDSPTF